MQACIEKALLEGPQGLMGVVGGDPRDSTALLSGLPGECSAALSRHLTRAGIPGERLLFADFF